MLNLSTSVAATIVASITSRYPEVKGLHLILIVQELNAEEKVWVVTQ